MKQETYQMIFYVLGGIALLYLISIHPWREDMTNADVQKKINPSVTKPSVTKGEPIIGPLAPKLDPNEPAPSISGGGTGSQGVYPNIYGPELLKAPGHEDTQYDYLPAAEFPAGPAEPAPYLNDFSKILKM